MDSFSRSIAIYLKSLQDAGVTDFQSASPSNVDEFIERVEQQEAAVSELAPVATVDDIPETPPVKPEATVDRGAALEIVNQQVRDCTRCAELCAKRTQTVFGVGDPHARLCFFGEAPGADEDRLGEPFVGKAGQLLDRIIGACTLKREEVYILNTVKCRPPGNRNPSDDEIYNCWEYAEKQLDIIQPEFIVCLGSVAARTLLQTKQSIGRLRQTLHQYKNSRVAVTYHPAYLLRNPSAKRNVWDDMKMVMREMGVEL